MKKKSLAVMQEEVRQQIQVGMDIDDAKKTMGELGFECEVNTNATLRYHATQDAITMTKRENVNFVNCVADRTQK